MLSRKRRYSGLPSPSSSTRMRIMKSWPTFSSRDSECRVFCAQISSSPGRRVGAEARDSSQVRAAEPNSASNSTRGRGLRNIWQEHTAEMNEHHPQSYAPGTNESACTWEQRRKGANQGRKARRKDRVALGTELRLGGGRLRRQRSAIRQDHMRNDVAVRSMAGSVVLNDCTLS